MLAKGKSRYTSFTKSKAKGKLLERKKIAQDAGKASLWLNIRIVTVVESADSQNSIGQQRNLDPNESRGPHYFM